MDKQKLKQFIPHYDMAAEANALLRGATGREIPGVSEEIKENNDFRTSVITIFNDEGAQIMERPRGKYITIDMKTDLSSEQDHGSIVSLLAKEISMLLPPENGSTTLICGIGNPDIASDALGENVVSRTIPTRHLTSEAHDIILPGFSSTSLITPNVLGNTGIEAAELVQAISHELAPRAVILIDALATASFSRLGTSFQLTDTGITPGGGVGNARPAINSNTTGCPVIAIGVPTVIYPQAIVTEVFSRLKSELTISKKETAASTEWDTAERKLYELMQEQMLQYAVTPKDIDCIIDSLADIISGSIQIALHEEITAENYEDYLCH